MRVAVRACSGTGSGAHEARPVWSWWRNAYVPPRTPRLSLRREAQGRPRQLVHDGASDILRRNRERERTKRAAYHAENRRLALEIYGGRCVIPECDQRPAPAHLRRQGPGAVPGAAKPDDPDRQSRAQTGGTGARDPVRHAPLAEDRAAAGSTATRLARYVPSHPPQPRPLSPRGRGVSSCSGGPVSRSLKSA
jgi:hypothetical protein